MEPGNSNVTTKSETIPTDQKESPPGNATSTPPVSWPLKARKMLPAAGLPKVLFVARKNDNLNKLH